MQLPEPLHCYSLLLESALAGLEAYVRQNLLALPPAYRLAFRELGLAIGLHAVERLRALWLQSRLTPGFRGLLGPPRC